MIKDNNPLCSNREDANKLVYGYLRECTRQSLWLRDIFGILGAYLQDGYGHITKLPIICELINPENQQMSSFEQYEIKYSIKSNWTMRQFESFMRKEVYYDYYIISGRRIQSETELSEVYEAHKDKDGFLYIKLRRAFIS